MMKNFIPNYRMSGLISAIAILISSNFSFSLELPPPTKIVNNQTNPLNVSKICDNAEEKQGYHLRIFCSHELGVKNMVYGELYNTVALMEGSVFTVATGKEGMRTFVCGNGKIGNKWSPSGNPNTVVIPIKFNEEMVIGTESLCSQEGRKKASIQCTNSDAQLWSKIDRLRNEDGFQMAIEPGSFAYINIETLGMGYKCPMAAPTVVSEADQRIFDSIANGTYKKKSSTSRAHKKSNRTSLTMKKQDNQNRLDLSKKAGRAE